MLLSHLPENRFTPLPVPRCTQKRPSEFRRLTDNRSSRFSVLFVPSGGLVPLACCNLPCAVPPTHDRLPFAAPAAAAPVSAACNCFRKSRLWRSPTLWFGSQCFRFWLTCAS